MFCVTMNNLVGLHNPQMCCVKAPHHVFLFCFVVVAGGGGEGGEGSD